MAQVNFIGPSYMLRSVSVDCQRTINMYPDVNEIGNGKSNYFLMGTPGLKTIINTKAPIRKIYTDSKNDLYTVEGTEFSVYRYVVADDYIERQVLGNLTTSTGDVDISDNGAQIGIVDGDNLYAYIYKDETFAQYQPEGWKGSKTITYFGPYFVFNEPNTQQFYISKAYDVTNIGNDFASKENAPDNLITTVALNKQLYLVGEKSMEIFNNTGDSAFPLSRAAGGSILYGCLARKSIAILENMMFFLGNNSNGFGTIYVADGSSSVTKISNFAVDYFLQSQESLEDAEAYAYQEDGHSFYMISFPTSKTSWCYDLTTKMWHERQYLDKNGQVDRHRTNQHTIWRRKHIVADHSRNKIYEMSLDFLDDDGENIQRIRRSPHMYDADSLSRIFFNQFEIDMDVGENPTDKAKIFLRYSNDGGRSWSNYKENNLGNRGNYRKKVAWRNLGSANDRVWEVSITDPIRCTILNAYVR